MFVCLFVFYCRDAGDVLAVLSRGWACCSVPRTPPTTLPGPKHEPRETLLCSFSNKDGVTGKAQTLKSMEENKKSGHRPTHIKSTDLGPAEMEAWVDTLRLLAQPKEGQL